METGSKPEASPPPDTQTTPPQAQEVKAASVKNKPASWQDRLLPLMGGMLTTLTAFFFLITFLQMSYLHWSIFRSPPIQMDSASSESMYVSTTRFEDLYKARQFEVRAAMERYIVEKRYHQISVLLMSGLWLRYLGFMTGMILALVGASFILGKLREPEQEMQGKFSQVSLSLRTTSPGIILAVLGVVLMFTTLIDKDVYDVKDANVYLSVLAPLTAVTPEAGEALPGLPDFFEAESLPDATQLTSTPEASTEDGNLPSLNSP